MVDQAGNYGVLESIRSVHRFCSTMQGAIFDRIGSFVYHSAIMQCLYSIGLEYLCNAWETTAHLDTPQIHANKH